MAFGILESRKTPHPPGTSQLTDFETGPGANLEAALSRRLKHGTGKNAHIVLIPQPTDDPNDPLNWPLWYRDLLTLCLIFAAALYAGGFGPLFGSIGFQLTLQYNVSFTKVSLLTGYQMLAVAISGVFVSPAVGIWGKRPVLVFCTLCGFGGSLWMTFADSYNSMLGARLLQGVGISFYEGVGFSVIGDLYFVHERGSRMSWWLLPVGPINLLVGLLTGVIAERHGVQWVYKIFTIFVGIITAIVLFVIPETAYNRPSLYNIESSSVENEAPLGEKEETTHKDAASTSGSQTSTPDAPVDATQIRKKSYLQSMNPFSGETFHTVSPFRVMIGPFKLLSNPAVYFAMLTQGMVAAWAIVCNLLTSQLFSPPPYNYTPAQVGYLNTGAIVGAIIAEFIGIAFNDKITKWWARRNNGIFEPEFRLWVISLSFVTGVIGFFGFGRVIADARSPIVVSTFYGFIFASVIFAHIASSAYMTDAFRRQGVEVFVDIMIFKNLLFFGFSFGVNDWVASQGPVAVFNTMGAVHVVISALAVVMYMFGKKNRALMYRTGLSTM